MTEEKNTSPEFPPGRSPESEEKENSKGKGKNRKFICLIHRASPLGTPLLFAFWLLCMSSIILFRSYLPRDPAFPDKISFLWALKLAWIIGYGIFPYSIVMAIMTIISWKKVGITKRIIGMIPFLVTVSFMFYAYFIYGR